MVQEQAMQKAKKKEVPLRSLKVSRLRGWYPYVIHHSCHPSVIPLCRATPNFSFDFCIFYQGVIAQPPEWLQWFPRWHFKENWPTLKTHK